MIIFLFSLRVKLLKKQFGLPSDLVSLRSLSLSPALSVQASAASNKSVSFPGQNHGQNQVSETLLEKSSNHHGDGSSYNGVHYVRAHHIFFRILNFLFVIVFFGEQFVFSIQKLQLYWQFKLILVLKNRSQE